MSQTPLTDHDPKALPLFDLPLQPEAEGRKEAEAAGEPEPAAAAAATRWEPQAETPASKTSPRHEIGAAPRRLAPEAVAVHAAGRHRAWLGRRVRAGLADLIAVLVAVAAAGGGALLLGVRASLRDWPAFALLAVIFSFLYTVVPLAFWGQTPGMSWAGLESHSRDGEPLSFGQAALHWLGGVLTLALAGLPLLMVLTGASVADRLSGSKTVAGRQ